jgi:hypothetical protein
LLFVGRRADARLSNSFPNGTIFQPKFHTYDDARRGRGHRLNPMNHERVVLAAPRVINDTPKGVEPTHRDTEHSREAGVSGAGQRPSLGRDSISAKSAAYGRSENPWSYPAVDVEGALWPSDRDRANGRALTVSAAGPCGCHEAGHARS